MNKVSNNIKDMRKAENLAKKQKIQSAYKKYEWTLNEVSKALYKANNPNSKIKCAYSQENAIAILENLKNEDEFKLAHNKRLGLRQQKHRFNIRIKKMLYVAYYSQVVNLGYKVFPFFVTLTFKNEKLDNTSEETRRKEISRFLKKYTFYYIANIDYGHDNYREHYHAICLLTEEQQKYLVPSKRQVKNKVLLNHTIYSAVDENNELLKSSFGWSTFEPVLVPELLFNKDLTTYLSIIFDETKDSLKISTYMNKLTNHAFKENLNYSLVYSKNKSFVVTNFYHLAQSSNIINELYKEFGQELEII